MDRCELCPNVHKCLPPEWGESSEYIFIGEAPGKREEQHERIFWGQTGQELTEHYLPLCGLKRKDVTITNTIKCLPNTRDGKILLSKQPHKALAECCAMTHLYGEIMAQPRQLIIPLGAFACHVIDPDIDLELQHGIPLKTDWGDVFPMYHPASGIHEPKRMLHIRNDWIRLGRYIRGRLHIPKDEYPNPDYKLTNAEEMLDLYLSQCNDYTQPLACDTEITRFGDPWCLTFSMWPGTGRMILAEDTESLAIFQELINEWQGPILFHNWLFDANVVSRMALHFQDARIVDTMVRAFHLGNLPQGLKALCYRLLGMKMQDFEDLVTPHSIPRCLEYLEAARDCTWPKPDEQLVRQDDGTLKLYKPQGLNTKLKRFFTDYSKNPNIDLFERWEKWSDVHEQVEEIVGPWPGKDIRYAPFDEALFYACRDADGLFRLWPLLEKMKHDMRRKPQDKWGRL